MARRHTIALTLAVVELRHSLDDLIRVVERGNAINADIVKLVETVQNDRKAL